MTKKPIPLATEAVEALYELMKSAESEPSRIQAAKVLLRQLDLGSDEDIKQEADEREEAIAEARELLEEFAALRAENLLLKAELAKAVKAGPDNA